MSLLQTQDRTGALALAGAAACALVLARPPAGVPALAAARGDGARASAREAPAPSAPAAPPGARPAAAPARYAAPRGRPVAERGSFAAEERRFAPGGLSARLDAGAALDASRIGVGPTPAARLAPLPAAPDARPARTPESPAAPRRPPPPPPRAPVRPRAHESRTSARPPQFIGPAPSEDARPAVADPRLRPDAPRALAAPDWLVALRTAAPSTPTRAAARPLPGRAATKAAGGTRPAATAAKSPRTAASARTPRPPRPPRLSSALGPGAFSPPPDALVAPDFAALAREKPAFLPDGRPAPPPAPDAELERLDPARLPSCARRLPHWHDDAPLWHRGAGRGLAGARGWIWAVRAGDRWWAAATPERPHLRHGGLWWTRRHGVWFAIHEGEIWAWRAFSEWGARGFWRPTDGARVIYSADLRLAAVLVPGRGATLFEVATGRVVGRWEEHELPRASPRPPAPPAGLTLPPGI